MMHRLYKLNLKQQFVLFFVLLIVLPILLAYWLVSVKVTSVTEKQMGDTLFQLAKTSHLTLDEVIASVDGTSEKLLISPEIRRLLDAPVYTDYDRLKEYLALDQLLMNYSSPNAINYSVCIPDLAMRYTFAPTSDVKPNGVFFSCDTLPGGWFQDAVNGRGSGIIRILVKPGDNASSEKTAAYVRGMTSAHDKDRPAAVLVITGLNSLLQKNIQSLRIPSGGQIVLLDKSNTILADNAENLAVGDVLSVPASVSGAEQGVILERNGRDSWMYAFHSSADSKTKLLFKIPRQSIVGEHEGIRQLFNTLMIAYFILLLLASLYFIRHILSPLSRLTRLTRSFEPGRTLGNDIRVDRHDEIGMLHQSFIEMTKRLNQTVHDKYVLELKHKESELALLHSQINPHLLYNTLESIHWRIRLEGGEESAEMVRDLSLLMRIGLSRGESLITVEEELRHVEAYIRLQLKRYEYGFVVHWDIEEETKAVRIPKVILQPLVENAILHGIRKMGSDGRLSISLRIKAGDLQIAIADNGYRAADISKLHAILEGKLPQQGYGITNVHRRIRLHFGDGYGLSYKEVASGGTQAVMVMPLHPAD
ncbi:two-component sensor histidine kinase [Paenibacillus pasadenensis]|uniref:Two-component sensor histidine kinase n=1 Tax=Paenibacillus pasadenensis TaxID=217090 RepID=A0A2N5NA80_9BACL|nr:sensor histidine kinase [Paenibacillus pasadenensis]PLT47243.1 two-component sensor histidine kinase [Paenibacillus pasadenensis]